MIILQVVLLWFLTLAAAPGFAAPSVSLQTDNAMRFTLTREGFQILSESLSRTALKNIENQPIEAFETDMGSGITGAFSGVKYSVDFGSLHISPSPEGFIVDVDVDRLDLNIDRAQFYKWIIVMFSTTCLDTKAILGGKAPVHLRLLLKPHITEGRFEIEPMNVSFDMNADQFQVEGPRQCSGALGIGNLIRDAVRKALVNARDSIRTNVEKAVRDSGPALAQALNAVFNHPYPVTIGGMPGMPSQRLLLAVKPYAIHMDAEQIVFSLSVDVMTAQTEGPQIRGTTGKNLEGSEPVVAITSLRAALLNELMSKVIPALPAAFDVELSGSSVLQEIFSRQGLSMILPDLNRIELDDDTLYARVGFGQTPEFAFKSGPGGEAIVGLTIPDLRLMLEIKQNGQRRPYFNLAFHVTFHVEASMQEERFVLRPFPTASILVNGAWDPTYTPALDIFEADVAQMVFGRALDILYAGGPIAQFEAPPIQIDPESVLKIRRPHVTDGFLGVDWVKP